MKFTMIGTVLLNSNISKFVRNYGDRKLKVVFKAISGQLCVQEPHVRKGWSHTAGTLPFFRNIPKYLVTNICAILFLLPAFNTEEILRLLSLIFCVLVPCVTVVENSTSGVRYIWPFHPPVFYLCGVWQMI